MEEMVDVVDENNRFVRKATRSEVREKALLHKAIRVIIIDNEGKLLAKKRSVDKDIYPSYWELGVGETVTSSESCESAAIRGLDEECGIIYVSNIQLIHSFLFKLKYRSPNYNANFKVYRHLHNGKLKPSQEETEEAKFLTASEVKKLIEQGLFEPTSTEAFEKYLKRELIDIVDDNDKVLRQATWEEMHSKGLLHRTANVFVFNSKGELFVHKRNGKLPLYPGMYDVKMGGIAKAGESYEEAARRELEEEAGIKNTKLEYLFSIKFRSKENNNNRKVFKCVYDGKIKLQPEEVESGRFITITEAKKILEEGKLSPSAVHVFKEYLKRTERK